MFTVVANDIWRCWQSYATMRQNRTVCSHWTSNGFANSSRHTFDTAICRIRLPLDHTENRQRKRQHFRQNKISLLQNVKTKSSIIIFGLIASVVVWWWGAREEEVFFLDRRNAFNTRTTRDMGRMELSIERKSHEIRELCAKNTGKCEISCSHCQIDLSHGGKPWFVMQPIQIFRWVGIR